MRPVLSAAMGPVLAVDEAPNPWFDVSWVVHNWPTIMPLLGQHVRLTVISVLVGAVIALPLALLARSSRVLTGPVLAFSTIVYTIPSLAMFAFIAPYTGLTELTVEVGLVLYSLVILVRNFLVGLQSVPAEVREAASGMG
ncbi:MAG: ABC transporter permease, partial [Blastococcus sp.]